MALESELDLSEVCSSILIRVSRKGGLRHIAPAAFTIDSIGR